MRHLCIKLSESEREKKSHISAHIWNLERWYWWSYLQGFSGEADTETRLIDTVREGEAGMNWKSSIETYTLPYAKQITSGNLLYHTGSPNLVLCKLVLFIMFIEYLVIYLLSALYLVFSLIVLVFSCVWLGDPMDCNLPGPPFHRIFQARILEWVAISYSRGSFQLRGQTTSPALVGRFFATAPPGKPHSLS